MDLEQAIRTMSERSGVGLRAASRAAGHVPTYINALLSRGSRPRVDVLEEIAGAFGYRLVLSPRDGGEQIVLGDEGTGTD